jgi:hypothetical protein
MALAARLGRFYNGLFAVKYRLVAAGIALAAAVGSTAAAAPSEGVTLRMVRSYDPACGCYKIEFSGEISSRTDNEYVTVMQQKCGFQGSTAIAGATTDEAGSWHTPAPGPVGSGTLRARWRGNLSEPVSFRAPLSILLYKQRQRRHRVIVGIGARLGGRVVALQRLAGGRWRHVRRIQLKAEGNVYWAVFAVPTRGLRLRIFVPAKTAAPCHDPAASATFVS